MGGYSGHGVGTEADVVLVLAAQAAAKPPMSTSSGYKVGTDADVAAVLAAQAAERAATPAAEADARLAKREAPKKRRRHG